MSDAGNSLRRASALIQQGRLEPARELLGRCLDLDPAPLDAHMMMAMIEARAGNLTAAGEHAQAYLDGRPADAAAWYNLGFIRQQQDRPRDAVAAYRRARELEPGHLPTAINLARVLDGLGETEEAVRTLDEILANDPSQPAAANELGSILLRSGDAARARALLEAAAERAPEDPRTWMNLGIALAKDDSLEAARAAYCRALELDPGSLATRLNLAKALVRGGELEAALTEIDRGLERHAGEGEAWNARSVILARLDRSDEALAAARKATELSPRDAHAWYNLASVQSKLTDAEDLRGAAEAARRCLDLAPEHAAAHQCLAIVLAKQGRVHDAIDHARRACSIEPEMEHWLTLGDLLSDAGRLPEAVRVLRENAGNHSAAPAARRQLGITLLCSQQSEAALAELDATLALAPFDQRAIAHRAVALQQLGRRDVAAGYLGLDEHVYARELDCPPAFGDLGAFNRQLAQDIRNHSRLRWEPVGLAARNGGLTDDLMADRTPAIEGFYASLRGAIDELRARLRENPDSPFLRSIPGPGYRLNLWATLVEEGGNIDTHIHEESWLSGAYYVALPAALGEADDDPAGWIEFGRPHRGMPVPTEAALSRLIRPRPGLLLLFPSYLFHRTVPHHGSEQRISISFDLTDPGRAAPA